MRPQHYLRPTMPASLRSAECTATTSSSSKSRRSGCGSSCYGRGLGPPSHRRGPHLICHRLDPCSCSAPVLQCSALPYTTVIFSEVQARTHNSSYPVSVLCSSSDVISGLTSVVKIRRGISGLLPLTQDVVHCHHLSATGHSSGTTHHDDPARPTPQVALKA